MNSDDFCVVKDGIMPGLVVKVQRRLVKKAVSRQHHLRLPIVHVYSLDYGSVV